MDFIRVDEIADEQLETARNNIGEEIKNNHDKCGDTRGRLYVKSPSKGILLAHCFNCGRSGFIRDKETFHNISELLDIKYIDKKKITKLVDADGYDNTTEDWNGMGGMWLRSYGINEEIAEKYGIKCYNKNVRLPYILNGKVEVIQTRYFKSYHKYSTFIANDVVPFVHYKGEPGSAFVICEDMLSAYKLNMAGYSCHALLGTSLSTNNLANIIICNPLPANIVIWLDDDDAGTRASMELHKTLNMVFSERMIRCIKCKQPKEFNTHQIKDMIG